MVVIFFEDSVTAVITTVHQNVRRRIGKDGEALNSKTIKRPTSDAHSSYRCLQFLVAAVIGHPWDYASHAPTWVRTIAFSPRNKMKVAMHYGLASKLSRS